MIIKDINKYSKTKLLKMYNNLPDVIKNKADKQFNEQDKNLTILEYSLLQKKLNNDLSNIKYTKKGKPFIENNKKFSISHSKNILVIAIKNKDVGVDVQHILNFDESIANLILNENELNLIKNSKNKDLLFTIFWTKKESIIKLKAEGFNQDLKNIISAEYIIKTIIKNDYVISCCTYKKKD